MISHDLKMAGCAHLWAQESFNLSLDPWQELALKTSSKQSIWNICRQGGKSSIAALKSLHKSIYTPGSLTLMISKSERQSGELYRKFLKYYDQLDTKPSVPEDKALSCTLSNGSRVIALPGVEDSIRCYSSVNLIIEDEAAYVPDALYQALRPMLAISHGDIILMSTPNGRQGHFYETFTCTDPTWFKLTVTADKCPRISEEFLQNERLNMPESKFRQEYFCEFISMDGSLFSSDLFKSLSNPKIQSIKI
jgi:hypothetical protein